MTEFEGVVPALSRALTKRGYEKLTPVQLAVLAPELKGADALVSAQTGSGKTVAFGLALAPTLLGDEERFEPAHKSVPLALTIAPTRELALQVMRELEWLYAETGAKVVSCVGGMDMRAERRALQHGAHIVVGTPGRLRDHVERGSFDTSMLKAVVLDEADEMLDMGFRDDLEYILDSSPKDRRTLMFSATVPRSIGALAKRYQKDAVRLEVKADAKQHLDIQYRALTVAPNDKENAIINVLRFHDAKNAIVFCATRATVNRLTSRLGNRGFSVVALSGELSQNERSHALQAMRDGRARVCVATDVAARGIDLPNLELVVHADIPKNAESLLHRSGRTGRAGRKGVSTLIIPHNWRKRTERLLQNAKIEATWDKPPSVDDITARDHERSLDNPVLVDPIKENEKAFVQELLGRHSAEQIAVAFMRLQQEKQPAAEELIDSGPPERGGRWERGESAARGEGAKRPARDDFKNGVWLSLSVGRKHNAEARWLLPMLCRAGHITKNEIGAIKIHQNETHVELTPQSVDKFLEAVGPSRKVEKSITVTRLNGVPDAPNDSGSEKPGNFAKRKKPYDPTKPSAGAKRKYSNRSDDVSGDDKPREKKSWDKGPKKSPYKAGGDKPYKPKGDKPYKGKSDGADRGKKPFKAKFAGKGGSAPLKRKQLSLKDK